MVISSQNFKKKYKFKLLDFSEQLKMSEGKLSQIRGKITGVKPKDSNGDTEKLPYVVDDEDYTPNR